jgi:hypothetical protein
MLVTVVTAGAMLVTVVTMLVTVVAMLVTVVTAGAMLVKCWSHWSQVCGRRQHSVQGCGHAVNAGHILDHPNLFSAVQACQHLWLTRAGLAMLAKGHLIIIVHSGHHNLLDLDEVVVHAGQGAVHAGHGIFFQLGCGASGGVSGSLDLSGQAAQFFAPIFAILGIFGRGLVILGIFGRLVGSGGGRGGLAAAADVAQALVVVVAVDVGVAASVSSRSSRLSAGSNNAPEIFL